MHHLLTVLFGALAGAMSATAPIYAGTAGRPHETLVPDESVAV
jgi:hypothetical protein